MSSEPFGSEFGKKYFGFRDGLINLNHGSFGAVAKPVLEAQKQALDKVHAFPDLYYRTIAMDTDPRLEVRSKIARFVNADVNNLVCVFSATTAFNAVFRAYPFKKGDKVVYMSSIYVNDINTLKFLAKNIGIELVEFVIDYPRESESEFLARYRQCLRKHNPKIAIFDTVSSMPSDVFPWEHMCEICREEEVLSFVDGAHGIGLIPISLKQARPTFFCSNLHKWFFVGQGACVFYVDHDYHYLVKGFPIAAFDSLDDDDPKGLAKTFGYMSTMDYSSMDSISAAFEFREQLGEADIVAYQNDLSIKACKLVCEELGVKPLVGGPPCAVFTVECPLQPLEDATGFINYVGIRLMKKWNTYIPIALYREKLYIRFSATIYLDLTSFEYGIKALKECFDAYSEELEERSV